jgi:alkanesulfonate monooxygenase SsuD/methylene tetrahydromethanopterin reductase-like flavin-dependent oxidoreductase (luciferase family)
MARSLRVGIQLPEVEREVRWPEYLAMARAAEAVGFDSIWIGDHLLYRADGERERGPWEAWTLLAALAAATRRVDLGPLVACAAFHPPGLIAKMAATVAEVGGGRFVLGLGAGWNEEEFRAFGLPFDHRVSRFEESFAIVRRLLAGERVTLTGRHWQVQDAVLVPAPTKRPRLMIGSNGPRMLAITLPHVDAWNTWYDDFGNSAEGFARLNDRISDAARSAGRDPAQIERSACVLVVLDRSDAGRAITPEARPLEGSSRQIAASLHELAEAGADEAILVVSPISERSIRRLAEVVALLKTATKLS